MNHEMPSESINQQPASQPEVRRKSTLGQKVKRAMAGGFAALTIGTVGCEKIPNQQEPSPEPGISVSEIITPEVTSTPSPEITATPSPVVTPEVTPEVTSTPSSEVTPNVSAERQAEILAQMSDYSEYGIFNFVENGQGIYRAGENNVFGFELNQLAGKMYEDVVKSEDEELHNIDDLVSELAKAVVEKQIAEIPNGENKWKMIIPFDLSEIKNDTQLSICTVLSSKTNTTGIYIQSNNPEDLVNTYLNINNFTFGSGSSRTPLIFTNITDNSEIFNLEVGQEIFYIQPADLNKLNYSGDDIMESFYYLIPNLSETPQSWVIDPSTSFGDEFGYTTDSIIISGQNNKNPVSMDTSDLLTIKNGRGQLSFISILTDTQEGEPK